MKKILQQLKWVILLFPLFLNNSCSKHGTLNGTLNGPFGPSGPFEFHVGDNWNYGIIAYVYQPSDSAINPLHYTALLAAKSDQSTGADWGCTGTLINGADGQAGNTNTSNIIAGCSAPGIAARICADLDFFGYNDWHLPSKEELNKLYQNRAKIGGFGNKTYWSSTQSSNNNAWNQNFSNGTQGDSSKNKMYNVRAVSFF